jgi:hypothetical protein
MRYKLLITLLYITVGFNAFSQGFPAEFMAGLKQIQSADKAGAKANFLLAVDKAPTFFGSYHFLGDICQGDNKLDSAAWYFKKSIELNTNNLNHTKELTYARLVNNYVYQHDFKGGFDVAWDALKQFPESNNIKAALKDLCLWAFYIKYDKLDPSYLGIELKEEYLVNSIPQEYLIVRRIKVDGETPVVTGQSVGTKNKATYDMLTCNIPPQKKTITVNFKLNWDLTKDFGGKIPATAPVIGDTKKPVYERLGAMLIADDKVDVKAAIEKMTM